MPTTSAACSGPSKLTAAARSVKDGKLDAAGFRAVQDECIREAVALQESIGVPAVTDGEFRRRAWSSGFIESVEGFGLREGTILGFHDEKGDKGSAPSPYAKARLKRARGIATEEFRFLKSVVKKGTPKITLPAPDVMHFFLGPRSADEKVYPDIEQFYADLTAIYRAEIGELAKLGCTYLQLDDTALPCNCDEHARADVRARGEDPDALTARYVRLANDVARGLPAGHGEGDPHVPRQPARRLDGRGRLRADRRARVQRAGGRRLPARVRLAARRRLPAAALPAEGEEGRPGPGLDEVTRRSRARTS